MLFLSLVASLSLSALVSAHPHPHAPIYFPQFRRQANNSSAPFSGSKFPAVQAAMEGNARFRATRNETLLRSLVADGQKPPFMMVSCSDSRAPEATIFDSQPGTFFMERNIANQYKPGDENAQSVMAYGVRVLGAQHVVVMGHYGCGGIAAAIASAPKNDINVATHIIQTWISDIRALYLSSSRSEIVEMRTRNLQTEATGGKVPEPEVGEAGFRALVEENVKQQVQRITQSSVISNLNEEIVLKLNPDGTPKANSTGTAEKRSEEGAKLIPVFVHGWVHDLETGEVIDLNISAGPKGFENFTPAATNRGEIRETATSTGEAAATSPAAAFSEGAANSTRSAQPTATPALNAPTGVAEVKVHGPGSRPADAPAKMKRSQPRRLT